MSRLSIFTTSTNWRARQEPYQEAMACYNELADEVINVRDPWPQGFKWDFIGQQFQKGYEQATGDWVIHADLDYQFHEKDFAKIRQALEINPNAPALSFYKYQFIIPDRYTLKFRCVMAVNKAKFGDRIRFDGGGDLCQPTLDGQLLSPNEMPETGVAFYNYDFTFKSKPTIKRDFARFARAWQKQFGDYKLGGPDEESAFQVFMQMMTGRFNGREHKQIPLEDHPKFIQNKLRKLSPGQFGYNGFGNLPTCTYVKENA